jgi:4'-phosphopantetheinyl transferase
MTATHKHWQTAPANYEIDGKTVHIWRSCFEVSLLSDSSFVNSLSNTEMERARRFVRRPDRDRYMFAHAILRYLLGSYLGSRPEELDFATNDYGKPFIIAPGGNEISFSLSHSQDMALVAIARGTPLGVDVEYLREISDAHDIVNRFFSIEERDYLNSLPLSAFYEEFFACWSLKEAYLKGIGKGLSFPLDRFSVMFSSKQPEGCEKSHHVSVRVDGWNMEMLPLGKGYSGGLAVYGPMRKVELFEIEPPHTASMR